MSASVLVAGVGNLADLVCKELSGRCQVVRQADLAAGVPVDAKLALMLQDAWHPAAHVQAEQAMRQAGIPWLRGAVRFGEGVVGPWVRPDAPGCSCCADERLLIAGSDRPECWSLLQSLAARGGRERDAWASRTGLLQMACLLADEAERFLQGRSVRTEAHLFLIDLKTLAGTRHFFLPDPHCPICAKLPDDSPEAAQIVLQPNLETSRERFRSRSLDELKQVLVPDYLDARTGIFNKKMKRFASPFAEAIVNLPLFHMDEGTAGRTTSYAASEMTAILEGLERYCGISPRGKRTVVRDSYLNLARDAINPATVGLHAPNLQASPGFPFPAYDPNRVMEWVWGYSFLQERPVLVPERLAYYSVTFGEGFVYETSNGCAVGGTLEEAILYGMLEVVERDAFLLTWYAQLPVPCIDPRSIDDKELQVMIDRLREVAGYDLHLFNTTMENGIPSVWALAKNRRLRGLNLICAAGAHPDPVRAVKGAVHEVAGMVRALDAEEEARHAQELAPMLRDPFRVVRMEHHAELYGLPEAEERLQFLLGGNRPLLDFGEAFQPRKKHSDLTDDLLDLLRVFRRLQLDVIVIDQTAPELRRNGLHCAKVLIPGMLPMTFGHHLTRLTGLQRVLRVPVQLGHASEPLTMEQLNPHPHPFP